jgi:hypothetical protein
MAESDAAYGDYKVTIPHSMHIAIRHLPNIVAHCTQIARKGAAIGGDGWEVIVQNDPQTKRPRAYIVCRDPAALERDARDDTLMRILSGLRGS